MKKIVMIISSGSVDKLQTMATVVAGFISLDIDVFLYFMFDAAWALNKNSTSTVLRVKSVYPEVEERYNKELQEGKVSSWQELLEDLKEIGNLDIAVCDQMVTVMDMKTDDLLPIVDKTAGVAVLTEEIMKADKVVFI
ncbi:MAG: hypothetical protein ACXAEU_16995 [Candidatus Hodarchaeales archaeon]